MITPTVYGLLTGGSFLGGIIFSPLLLLFIILTIGYIMAALFSIVSLFDKKLTFDNFGKSVAGNWTTVLHIAQGKPPVQMGHIPTPGKETMHGNITELVHDGTSTFAKYGHRI